MGLTNFPQLFEDYRRLMKNHVCTECDRGAEKHAHHLKLRCEHCDNEDELMVWYQPPTLENNGYGSLDIICNVCEHIICRVQDAAQRQQ